MDLSSKIEAVLFFKGEPVSGEDLADLFEVSGSEIESALDELKLKLETRGLRLIRKDGKALLASAPQMYSILERLVREELSRELTRAALETLAIIIYCQPVSRARIDYIRGVNSQFILRSLSVRGLVERTADPSDRRGSLYRPTFDLLSHLGVESLDEMPEYSRVRERLQEFEKENVE